MRENSKSHCIADVYVPRRVYLSVVAPSVESREVDMMEERNRNCRDCKQI
jgi:hypothetical protein